MVQAHFQGKRAITLAQYLLKRLSQYGCHHIHGVPGDFCLPFLSQVTSKTSPVRWIGNTNELNAAYAADGYSRITGLGALCTTYGVGELSAINGIAGSFAERVSVMHIVGLPRRALQQTWNTSSKNLVHHMLGYGRDPRTYQDMAKKVTTVQVKLDEPLTAAETFDRALTACLSKKRPVYVELPSDMANEMVHEDRLNTDLSISTGGRSLVELDEIVSAVVKMLEKSERPLIMVDGLSYRYQLRAVIDHLATNTGIPIACLPSGLGMVRDDLPNYVGVATDEKVKEYMASADLVLLIGPLLSDTNTAGWTAIPSPKVTVSLHGDEIEFEGIRRPLDCKVMLRRLTDSPAVQKLKEKNFRVPEMKTYDVSANVRPQSPITQDAFYPLLSKYFLKGRDTILLANGTPLIGAKLLKLPVPARVIASGLWLSVGHMLPAAQGVALAQTQLPEDSRGRTILLEGDGSFQATATELSTMIRYKLDATIFIVNNEGYAYEREIMGRTEEYNDVPAWDYMKIPRAFGGTWTEEYPVMKKQVRLIHELVDLLLDPVWNDGKGLKLVEVIMGKEDVPEYFREALQRAGERLISS